MNFYYWLGYHFSRLAGRLFFRLRVIHRERMIQSGPAILAMNHQSYLDPLLAGITSDRAIYFLARRTLLDAPTLGWLLPKLNVIPVNQEGVDRSAIKAVIRILNAGNAVLIFPEGSRTLDGNLQPAEPGLVDLDRADTCKPHRGGLPPHDAVDHEPRNARLSRGGAAATWSDRRRRGSTDEHDHGSPRRGVSERRRFDGRSSSVGP